MSEICAAAEYLRAGGPRTVPFRMCCVAAILRVEHGDDPFFCAAMDLTVPADAALIVAEAGVGQPT